MNNSVSSLIQFITCGMTKVILFELRNRWLFGNFTSYNSYISSKNKYNFVLLYLIRIC